MWSDGAISFSGVPFVIIGSKTLDCHFGKDRNLRIKQRKLIMVLKVILCKYIQYHKEFYLQFFFFCHLYMKNNTTCLELFQKLVCENRINHPCFNIYIALALNLLCFFRKQKTHARIGVYHEPL